jgi:hypothetical protein
MIQDIRLPKIPVAIDSRLSAWFGPKTNQPERLARKEVFFAAQLVSSRELQALCEEENTRRWVV